MSATLADIFHIIYAGQELVGANIPITLAIGFSLFLGLYGLTLYFFVILKSIRIQKDYATAERALQLKAKYDFLAFMVKFIPPTAFVATFMPLLGIIYPKYRDQFLRSAIFGIGSVAFVYGIIVTLAFSYLLESLANHIKKFEQTSQTVVIVHRRLRRACYVIASFTFQVGPLGVLWASYDVVLIRSTYIFLALLLTVPVACLTLIITVSAIVSDDEFIEHTAVSWKRRSINLFSFKRNSISPYYSNSVRNNNNLKNSFYGNIPSSNKVITQNNSDKRAVTSHTRPTKSKRHSYKY
jgi:hypothetical protein